MATISRSIDVRTSPEAAFAFLCDLRNLPRFQEGIFDFHVRTDAARGDGARCAYRTRFLLGSVKHVAAVSGFVEGRSFALTTVVGPPMVQRWSVQPHDGGTRITYTLGYLVPLPAVGWLLDALVMRRRHAARVARSMERLRTLLEGRG